MICKTECFLSAAFIGSSIYMMITDKSNSEHKEMYKSFSKEKQEIYKKIKKERLIIWFKASIIAIFLSVLVAYYHENIFSSTTAFSRTCITTLVYYGVQHLIYIMHPKTDYMLNHVENNKEAKAWLTKYKTMQRKWHTGFILGIFGYFLLSRTIFKNNESNQMRAFAIRFVN